MPREMQRTYNVEIFRAVERPDTVAVAAAALGDGDRGALPRLLCRRRDLAVRRIRHHPGPGVFRVVVLEPVNRPSAGLGAAERGRALHFLVVALVDGFRELGRRDLVERLAVEFRGPLERRPAFARVRVRTGQVRVAPRCLWGAVRPGALRWSRRPGRSRRRLRHCRPGQAHRHRGDRQRHTEKLAHTCLRGDMPRPAEAGRYGYTRRIPVQKEGTANSRSPPLRLPQLPD